MCIYEYKARSAAPTPLHFDVSCIASTHRGNSRKTQSMAMYTGNPCLGGSVNLSEPTPLNRYSTIVPMCCVYGALRVPWDHNPRACQYHHNDHVNTTADNKEL